MKIMISITLFISLITSQTSLGFIIKSGTSRSGTKCFSEQTSTIQDDFRRDLLKYSAAAAFSLSLGPLVSLAPGASSSKLSIPANDKMLATIASKFPGALPATVFEKKLGSVLTSKVAKSKDSIMLATSFCSDELNRDFEENLTRNYGGDFNLGGLAGFPFAGVTGFSAMSSHIPDNGSCCVVYGPHVGVNHEGLVGTVERHGRANGGSCCGSAIAAKGFVMQAMESNQRETIVPQSFIDAEQTFVGDELLKYGDRLVHADDVMVEVPFALLDSQKQAMEAILNSASKKVASPGKIAVVGGILINTPPGEQDYFLPKFAEIRSNKNIIIEDFLSEL